MLRGGLSRIGNEKSGRWREQRKKERKATNETRKKAKD